jgi:N-acetylglucosamine repressor
MASNDTKSSDYIGTSRKPRNIKLHNQRVVISVIREARSVSVREVATRINLSVTTVTKIFESLQQQDIIRSAGKGSSTLEGGKRPEIYNLNENYRYAFGCYINSTQAVVSLVNFKGKNIDERRIRFAVTDSLNESFKKVAGIIRSMTKDARIDEKKICGVAAGFDGIVDADRGIVKYPIRCTGWGRDIPVRDILKELLPEYGPIIIDNGGRFASYAQFVEAPEYRNKTVFNVIAGDYSVGCLIEKGEIERGSNGFLGEIGHMTILPSYRKSLCTCGNYGCFETLVSPNAIIGWAKDIGKETRDDVIYPKIVEGRCGYQDIFDAANRGNAFAQNVVGLLAGIFSMLIRNIALSCDPEVIVISGIYANAGRYFEETLLKKIQEISLFNIERKTVIRYAKNNKNVNSQLGGALYVLDNHVNTIEII